MGCRSLDYIIFYYKTCAEFSAIYAEGPLQWEVFGTCVIQVGFWIDTPAIYFYLGIPLVSRVNPQ